MVDITTRMCRHTARWLEHLGVDHVEMEDTGLGLRPLKFLENIPRETRGKLARRYYRMAQWREVSQGGVWLNVSQSVPESSTQWSCRTRTPRSSGTTRWRTSLMMSGELCQEGLEAYSNQVQRGVVPRSDRHDHL